MASLARVVDMPSRTMRGNVANGARIRRSRRTVPLRSFSLVLVVVAFAILVWSDLDEPVYVGDSPQLPQAAHPVDRDNNLANHIRPNSATPGQPFLALLQQGAFEAAVELYAHTYSRGDEQASHPYREAILQQVSIFIQSREYDRATALLDSYLAVFYRDSEALVYAGRAYRENRQYRPAVEAFLRASQQDQHPDRLRMVNGQLSWTIGLYVQQLREQERTLEIVDLYTYLTQAEPRNPHYFIALARAYVSVDQTSDALAALQFVAADDDAGAEAREVIAEIHAGL